jgi:tetratricopeptide (TPR) repeat protein
MILLLAVWLVATPFEMPDTEQPWARITTSHFDIISSSGDRRTRELARDLETLAAALAGMRPAATPTPHTRVFVFARRREVQPYFDLLMHREKADVSGAFVAQTNSATMFIDDSRGRMSDRTPYHELVHYLMGNASQRAPLWVEEGLAEYYSSAEVHGGIIRVGVPIREHIERLKRGNLTPVAELFTTTDSIEQTFYAESWAIVDWMITRDRRAFDAFFRDVLSGTPSDVALQKHFHKTPADIERLITSRGSGLPDVATTLQVRVPEITSDATRVDRAELLYELGHFLASLDSARNVADQYLAAAIDANPKQGEFVLGYAEFLLRDPPDATRFRRARELAQKALDLGADRARSLGAIGASYVVESDWSPGIAPLETAVALAPNRDDLQSRLQHMRIRIEVDHINALVKAGKLDEAAALTRALAAKLPDAPSRQQLEDQAKQLESDAASNREITTFNEAVELFNKGDYKSAKKIIDELLKSARSEQVLTDATKLKTTLDKLLKK